ncbi:MULTISPECIES: DMT family transporter [Vibrio]|uniref:EamA family transporter n=2 Tax=Vibrio TaxID=662 RepID=A0A7X4LNM8_9VIBR|nr:MULTISPECIES: DMT family transporter [Vibrio]MBF9000851.1 DMT family transporter [Vibrio nitrifigilis]MZI95308.1 EamA family transporter [Vibrio eleionomae]
MALPTPTRSILQPIQRMPYIEMLLLLVAIFWGTSYAVTKQGLNYTDVMMFIALRFSITFICLLPALIRDILQATDWRWVNIVPTGVILATIFFCEVYGVAHTSASKAAFIISLCVIFTALLEPIINRQRVSKRLIVMALISVLGVALLTGIQPYSAFELQQGDGFILLAALLRALMVTTTKRFSTKQSLSSLSITAIQSGTVSMLAIVSCWVGNHDFSLPAAPNFWFIIIYLVLGCTLFAFFIQNYAIQKTSPTKVALLMGSEPLFGALFAMAWLNETLTINQIIGGILILISVLITSREQSNH